MAKGLNLTDTGIEELRINIIDNGKEATIQTLIPIYDDNGELVKYETKHEKFSDLSTQRKVNLNNYFRLSNQKYNQDLVNESKDSWTDIQSKP